MKNQYKVTLAVRLKSTYGTNVRVGSRKSTQERQILICSGS